MNVKNKFTAPGNVTYDSSRKNTDDSLLHTINVMFSRY